MNEGFGTLLTYQERAALLAGLRLLQIVQQEGRVYLDAFDGKDVTEIATNDGEFPILPDSQIEDLCERLNCSGTLVPS